MGELGDLVVDLSARGERATALYRALLEAVRGGRLRPGERLPPTRVLAADLGVSRTTVATAYDRLVAEGYLEARVGAGTYVAALAEPVRAPRRGTTARAAGRVGARPAPDERAVAGAGARLPGGHPGRAAVPLRHLAPPAHRRVAGGRARPRHVRRPGRHAPLRAALARHLALSRGVQVPAEEVLITLGTQQALDLVTRVLVAPGDVVAVEDPGYPLARDLFAACGAQVVPVPVDEHGLVVEALPEAARLVFTTPSHQFPFGPPMTMARRRSLLAFAERHRCAVVEDDYDSEFRFTERPLETLLSMDTAGRVLYLGSFSKSLVPGLRLGFLVAPAPLQEPLRAALQLSVGYAAVPEQAALARFVDDGLFARHLRRARAAYAEKRALVLEAVHGPLAPPRRARALPGRAARQHPPARPGRRRHRRRGRGRRAGRGGRGAVVVLHGGAAARPRHRLRRGRAESIRPGLRGWHGARRATSTPSAPAPMSAGPSRAVPVSSSSPRVGDERHAGAAAYPGPAREQPERGRGADDVHQGEGAGGHQQRASSDSPPTAITARWPAHRAVTTRASARHRAGCEPRPATPAATRRGPGPRRAGRRRRSRRSSRRG